MPVRYDDYTKFHNPSAKVFVGRWEMEDYIIEPAETVALPAWLARHFAKRLCDQVMIKKYGEPLKPDHKKRKEFMTRCLPGATLESTVDAKPKTTKQQIENDRQFLYASKAERAERLRAELAALEDDDDERVERPAPGLQDETDPTDDDDEVPETQDTADGPGEVADDEPAAYDNEKEPTDDDDEDDDDEPVDDDDDDDEDEPLTAKEREAKAAAAIKRDSKKQVKAFEEGGLRNIKNPIGSKQRPVKDKKEAPVFDGDVGKADSKLHSSLEQDLALQADE